MRQGFQSLRSFGRKAGDKQTVRWRKGIGLFKCKQEDKAVFGDEYGVTLENSYGRGTCAIIKSESQR